MSQFPFIDDHATTIGADVDDVWDALLDTLDRAFSRTWTVRYARLVGCADATASGPRPLTVGSTLPGFRVLAAVPRSQLVLAGRHRFTTGVLIFLLEPLGPDRTYLTAETRAAFHGFAGRVYRLLVIGSRGHVVAVRRLLAAIERRSTRAFGDDASTASPGRSIRAAVRRRGTSIRGPVLRGLHGSWGRPQ